MKASIFKSVLYLSPPASVLTPQLSPVWGQVKPEQARGDTPVPNVLFTSNITAFHRRTSGATYGDIRSKITAVTCVYVCVCARVSVRACVCACMCVWGLCPPSLHQSAALISSKGCLPATLWARASTALTSGHTSVSKCFHLWGRGVTHIHSHHRASTQN